MKASVISADVRGNLNAMHPCAGHSLSPHPTKKVEIVDKTVSGL